MAEVSMTATQIALDRKHNEEVIVAEASLYGETFLTWARLGMFAIWGLSIGLGMRLSHFERTRDSTRLIIIAVYLVLAVGALRGVRKNWKEVKAGLKKASVKEALFWPIAATLVDFLFVAAMNWRNHSVGRYYPSGFVAGCMFFMAFALVRFSTLHVVLATALASVTYLSIDQFVVGRESSWLEALFVIASFIGFGLLIGFANRRIRGMFVDYRRRENLQRFLPRQVADRVMKNAGLLAPTQREVTVLFTDIRDFTAMSETMAPNEVLRFLDHYFGHMSQIVKGHDGVVNKFLGDGMLAIWGAPDTDELHPEKALKAALDMRKKLKELNDERATEGKPPIRMGIGIHTGIVAAGMLGGADQHEYTVIGDAVNLASRIEGLTKSLGVDLLVSESTFNQLREKFDCARAGEEKVKGRTEPVVVFTVASSALATR